MVVGVAVGRSALDAVIILLTHVKLAANDGLDPGSFGGVYEMDRAKNIAMVGHGHGGHAQLFHALAKLFHVTGAVKQGVVGVEMQVDKLGHGLSLILRCAPF